MNLFRMVYTRFLFREGGASAFRIGLRPVGEGCTNERGWRKTLLRDLLLPRRTR